MRLDPRRRWWSAPHTFQAEPGQVTRVFDCPVAPGEADPLFVRPTGCSCNPVVHYWFSVVQIRLCKAGSPEWSRLGHPGMPTTRREDATTGWRVGDNFGGIAADAFGRSHLTAGASLTNDEHELVTTAGRRARQCLSHESTPSTHPAVDPAFQGREHSVQVAATGCTSGNSTTA